MGLVTGGIFIVLGVFVLCVATFGIFRFEYALNRIHVAAKCDTLGSMLILAGLIISNGWNMESAKIGLILLFIWIGNPAASHMVAKAEARSNPNLKEECGVSEYEGLFLKCIPVQEPVGGSHPVYGQQPYHEHHMGDSAVPGPGYHRGGRGRRGHGNPAFYYTV